MRREPYKCSVWTLLFLINPINLINPIYSIPCIFSKIRNKNPTIPLKCELNIFVIQINKVRIAGQMIRVSTSAANRRCHLMVID